MRNIEDRLIFLENSISFDELELSRRIHSNVSSRDYEDLISELHVQIAKKGFEAYELRGLLKN